MKNTTTYKIKKKIIEELKSKKSCGHDEITTKILEISSPYILSPLPYICNRILSTGTFPDRLKFSIVIPIYKKVTKHSLLITDQFHYFLYFHKFLKILYIKDYITI